MPSLTPQAGQQLHHMRSCHLWTGGCGSMLFLWQQDHKQEWTGRVSNWFRVDVSRPGAVRVICVGKGDHTFSMNYVGRKAQEHTPRLSQEGHTSIASVRRLDGLLPNRWKCVGEWGDANQGRPKYHNETRKDRGRCPRNSHSIRCSDRF